MVVSIITDDVLLSKEEIDDLVSVLNGIVNACFWGHIFIPGNRNEIILNMTVSSWLLDLDPIDVLEMFIKHGVIDIEKDDENTRTRVYRMLDYTEKFSWDYMLDPEYYKNESRKISDPDTVPVYFMIR